MEAGGRAASPRGGFLAGWFRFLVGLALIPVCVILTRAAVGLLRQVQEQMDDLLPPAVLAMAVGYGAWVLIYFLLPRPVRAYVLAHELTHLLWGWASGARASSLRVGSDGGSVTLSRTGVLVTLAPYFFPLYTVLVLVVYGALNLVTDTGRHQLLWLGAVGFTWAFHFTFTLQSLMQRQSDILIYGRLFSWTLIYLFNLLGVCLWTVAVSDATLWRMGQCVGADSEQLARWIARTVARMAESQL